MFRYRVRDRYPAKKTIEGIKAHLRAAGLTALKEDPTNPGTPSSVVRGWHQISFAHGPANKQVRYWIAFWQNKHGDTVRYLLQYETKNGKSENLSEVSVYVQYFSAADFKALVSEFARMRAKDVAQPPPPPR